MGFLLSRSDGWNFPSRTLKMYWRILWGNYAITPTDIENDPTCIKQEVNEEQNIHLRFNNSLPGNIDKEGVHSNTLAAPIESAQWYTLHIFKRFEPLAEFFTDVCPPQYRGCQKIIQKWCLELSMSLQEHASESSTFTFSTAVSHLELCGLLLPGSDKKLQHLQTYLVFCLIGLLTCLYRPTTYGLIHLSYTIEEIDSKISHRYSCIYNWKIKSSEDRRQVRHVLKGFGELLPIADGTGRTTLDHPRPLYPNQISAYILLGVVKLSVEWTDILGAHLDFDDQTKTLYVFKFPSFCLQNTVPYGNEAKNTILYATITDDDDEGLINNLMVEILLSTYLIFGQDVKARKFIQQHKFFQRDLQNFGDATLKKICQGSSPLQELQQQSKQVYHLPTDFPLVGAKLEYLRQFVLEQEPKGFKQLWKDKRNSLQWYTFWAVLVIGGVGILLALLQVFLGVMQVYYAAMAVKDL